MKYMFVRFLREDEGQDLIEYALLAGLIAVVAVTAIQGIGTKLNALFINVNSVLSSAS